tara:strand:- start:3606 stop:4520 length:915 start_codon:yes stop_codon:yes gene_type:complete
MFFSKDYKNDDGIFVLDQFDKTTKEVASFYQNNPFPNYDRTDDKFSINKKGANNILAKKVKELVGLNKNILEVGSGTCQLSNFFAIGTNNTVFALDPTIESLKVGKKFAQENLIRNVHFVNGSIFDEVFNREIFDLVWCSGVLHHTKDPYTGFQNCVNYLKKDGFIVIGLYNRYGRLRTYIRKIIYKLFGKKVIMKIDPILRKFKDSPEAVESWILDQYTHPVESTHTIEEVLDWFDKNNIKVVSTMPNITDLNIAELEKLHSLPTQPKVNISNTEILLTQLNMIFNSYGSDGGLYVLVGKKRG